MKRITSVPPLVSVLAWMFAVPAWLAADGDLPEPQVVQPIFNQTERDPTDIYVTPSASQPLSQASMMRSISAMSVPTSYPAARAPSAAAAPPRS